MTARFWGTSSLIWSLPWREQKCGSGPLPPRPPKAARRGMFWGTSVYAVTIALLFLIGLAAQQILPNVVEEFGTADAVVPALYIKSAYDVLMFA